MQYVFVGSASEVAGKNLTRFGQVVELDQSVAEWSALSQHAPIIPKASFDAIGFSDADLKEYFSTTVQQVKAPQAFLAKRTQAWQALHDWREELANPKPAAPPVVPEPAHEAAPEEAHA